MNRFTKPEEDSFESRLGIHYKLLTLNKDELDQIKQITQTKYGKLLEEQGSPENVARFLGIRHRDSVMTVLKYQSTREVMLKRLENMSTKDKLEMGIELIKEKLHKIINIFTNAICEMKRKIQAFFTLKRYIKLSKTGHVLSHDQLIDLLSYSFEFGDIKYIAPFITDDFEFHSEYIFGHPENKNESIKWLKEYLKKDKGSKMIRIPNPCSGKTWLRFSSHPRSNFIGILEEADKIKCMALTSYMFEE